MAKVSKNYRQSSEMKKIAMGYTVEQSMSSKDKFKTHKSQLDDLKTNLDAYQVAAVEAALGGTDRTLKKNDCVQAIVDGLDELAGYVDIMALTDENAISDSGFQSTKTVKSKIAKAPATELSTPTGFKVVNVEKSGVVIASCNKMANVVLYQITFMASDETVFVSEVFTKEHEDNIIAGFAKFARVKFKMRAISETGVTSDWSNIIEVGVD